MLFLGVLLFGVTSVNTAQVGQIWEPPIVPSIYKEKQNILSNRISSLSNELITVLVPEKYNVITEEIDMLFKIHAQFCQSGYAKIDEKKIPTSILKCVTEQKKLFAKLLRSIGGVLIVDD